MNTQERAKHALPLVQALAEGKVIQGRHKTQPGVVWEDLELSDPWYLAFDFFDFRVKPTEVEVTIKYRRALLRHTRGWYVIASGISNNEEVEEAERYPGFVKWLDTEWQHEVTTVPAQT